jgi:Terpene cyclase DEP1
MNLEGVINCAARDKMLKGTLLIASRRTSCFGETIMQWLYLVAAILGTVLPLSHLIPFLATYGLDLPLFFQQLFQNHVSGFFGMDVFVSSLVLWLFVFSEGRRRGMSDLWLYIVCSVALGVSPALPLFLFFRERKINAGHGAHSYA